MIGRLPYLYFLLLGRAEGRDRIGILPYCYFLLLLVFSRRDTQIGRLPYLYFLLLPIEDAPTDFRLEDCRIITSFYSISRCHTSLLIGRLPYYYFLLLHGSSSHLCADWNTAVFILPFTKRLENMRWKGLEHCRIYTSSYSAFSPPAELFDRKTAVLLLPFTSNGKASSTGRIGRLPYYYFLLLKGMTMETRKRLEYCRITTYFYSCCPSSLIP